MVAGQASVFCTFSFKVWFRFDHGHQVERGSIFSLVDMHQPFARSTCWEHGCTHSKAFLSLVFSVHTETHTHSEFSRKTHSMLHQHWAFFCFHDFQMHGNEDEWCVRMLACVVFGTMIV